MLLTNDDEREGRSARVPTLSLELPSDVLSAVHFAPADFVREMRIAAAVKWYEVGELSQGRAAEVAGLSRAEFLGALERYHVSPFQYAASDIERDLGDVWVLDR